MTGSITCGVDDSESANGGASSGAATAAISEQLGRPADDANGSLGEEHPDAGAIAGGIVRFSLGGKR